MLGINQQEPRWTKNIIRVMIRVITVDNRGIK